MRKRQEAVTNGGVNHDRVLWHGLEGQPPTENPLGHVPLSRREPNVVLG